MAATRAAPVRRFPLARPDDVIGCYRATLPVVHSYLLRLSGGDRSLAEDLTQETFLTLVGEVERGRLSHVEVGWLMVVARRKFLDHLRHTVREARRIERVRSQPEPAPDWDAPNDAEALALLGRLSPTQRAALVLRYVDDLPTAEVAGLLGLSVSATESLLARSRRNLARLLEEVRRGRG